LIVSDPRFERSVSEFFDRDWGELFERMEAQLKSTLA